MSNTLTQEKPGAYRFLVLALLFLAMIMCMGFNTTSTAILLPQWTAEMGWSLTQYGLIAGAIAMGQVWTVFFTGILLDKFNPKILLGIAVVLNGAIMFARGWISNFTTAYVILFLSGVTGAVINPGCLKVTNAWFDRKWVYKCNGILISGGAVGYFIGFNGTIPWSTSLGGWDKLFQVFGIIIAVVGILMLILIPSRTEAQGAMNKDLHVDTEGYTFVRKLKECLTSKQIILMILSEFFIAGVILSFSTVGALAFTTINEGMTTAEAGLAISMSNVGSCIGYWLLPSIADAVGYRKRFIMPAVIWSCTLYLLSPFIAGAISVGAAGFAIACAGFGNGFGLIGGRTLMMEHPDCAGIKAGTASGLLIELNKIGCVVFPLLFTTLFSSAGVRTAWIVMFICGMLGVIFIAFAQDTGKKADAKREAKAAAAAKAE